MSTAVPVPPVVGQGAEPVHEQVHEQVAHRMDRRVRGWLRRSRWTVALVALVLLAAALALALVRPTSGGLLAPDNPAPEGGRALARVLADHGVDVRTRNRLRQVQDDVRAAGRQVTLLVARPDLLTGPQVDDLLRLVSDERADLVLVAADNRVLSELGLPAGSAPLRDDAVSRPGCEASVPARAGAVTTGTVGYRVYSSTEEPSTEAPSTEAPSTEASSTGSPTTTSCYPVEDGLHGYVELTDADGRRTTLLGSPVALSNEDLAEQGNAALGVGALGRHPVLVWWTPDPLDVGAGGGEPASTLDLLPPGIRFGAAQLLVALAVVLLWRGRRLGRLVSEPLPVHVRAIETTRGRAQLYRRARARGRAAQVLRVSAVRRLAVRCGLPRTAPVPDVLDAVARVTGRDLPQVAALLVGPDPTDDPALVLLARALDALETEVHRS